MMASERDVLQYKLNVLHFEIDSKSIWKALDLLRQLKNST